MLTQFTNVYWASFRMLTFLPMQHTIEENRRFVTDVILNECEVTVAEDETGIVAFLARKGEEVRLLYTRSDRIGMGAGTQPIDAAKAGGIGALELWCFEANERARRFTKHEVFAPSALQTARITRSRRPMPGTGGNSRPASRT
jgi:hypothetical protein